MQNAITTLRIQNFKSIKDVTMQPRRVNIIIGEPNVGKSNILEAMSLLGGDFPSPDPQSSNKSNRPQGALLRYREIRQLFYDNNIKTPIIVETNNDIGVIGKDYETSGFRYLLVEPETVNKLERSIDYLNFRAMPSDAKATRILNFVPNWEPKTEAFFPQYIAAEIRIDGRSSRADGVSSNGNMPYAGNRSVRPYLFSTPPFIMSDDTVDYLRPPSGNNLLNIVQLYPNLRKEIAGLFNHYKLRLLVRADQQQLEVIKDLDGVIYSYPYANTADTLQRLIFHLAAIESNDDAVLLFEEPEAHSFPSYIMHLAQSIVHSRNNQFFVVTHSPYLLTEILEEMLTDDELKPELAIFTAYYEDYQTKVYQLTDKEMISARADGLDFFLNLRRFVPEAE